MKTKIPTREEKKEISQHFKKGGTVANLPNKFIGVPADTLKKCEEFAKQTDEERPNVKKNVFTTQVPKNDDAE